MTPRLIATVFGLGFLRPAPGTWASAVAIPLGLGLHAVGGLAALGVATVAAVALGFWACGRYLPGLDDQDPDEVVIDEIAGQWLTLSFPAAAFALSGREIPVWLPWPAWVAAFLLFRLFDVWKPWLVGRADRAGGVRGVMVDDLWAGLFAGVGVIAAGVLYHVVLFW